MKTEEVVFILSWHLSVVYLLSMEPMGRILRYNRYEPENTISRRDPLWAVMNWISGLRSYEYAGKIVKDHQSSFDDVKATKATKAITALAETMIGLLEQGLQGDCLLSFLPLFYAFQNAAKICIILGGDLEALVKQRRHGATYSPHIEITSDLLDQKITLKPEGTIPLFYKVLAHESLPFPGGTTSITVDMKDVYRRIQGVAVEYMMLYDDQVLINRCPVFIDEDKDSGFRLVVNASIKAQVFRNLSTDSAVPGKIVSPWYSMPRQQAIQKMLEEHVLDYMIYDSWSKGSYYLLSPLSGGGLLWPEEFPILLAFYHLSNVARYNPEYLVRLRDSTSWPMLLALRTETVFEYLLLFWCFIRRRQLSIHGTQKNPIEES